MRSTTVSQAVVQQRLILLDNEDLRQHMANAIARHNRRDWRLDKPSLERGISADLTLERRPACGRREA